MKQRPMPGTKLSDTLTIVEKHPNGITAAKVGEITGMPRSETSRLSVLLGQKLIAHKGNQYFPLNRPRKPAKKHLAIPRVRAHEPEPETPAVKVQEIPVSPEAIVKLASESMKKKLHEVGELEKQVEELSKRILGLKAEASQYEHFLTKPAAKVATA